MAPDVFEVIQKAEIVLPTYPPWFSVEGGTDDERNREEQRPPAASP